MDLGIVLLCSGLNRSRGETKGERNGENLHARILLHIRRNLLVKLEKTE
jgi:hypothetical protein